MRILSHLRQSRLHRNIIALTSGTAAGQAITLVFSPLITRIYSPEVFGLQGLFLSFVSILTPIIAMRYPLAIVVADNHDEATRLGQASMLISFLLALILSVVLAVAQQPVLVLVGAEQLGNLIWFLPLAVVCVAAQDVATFHVSRQSNFSRIGAVTAVQALLSNVARVLGGLLAPVAAVLVTVTSITPAIQALMLGGGGRRDFGARTNHALRDLLPTLHKHRDFPIYRAPNDLLNAGSQAVPVILLASLFSPAIAGLYVLTRSVLNLPMNLVGAAIGNVLYARFAELHRAGEQLSPLLVRSTFGLGALIPPIVGAAWFAPYVFAFVFGEEWREAGEYARWMSIWIAFMIANVPATRLAPVIRRQAALMAYNIVLLVIRVAAVWIPFSRGGQPIESVAWYSVTSAVMAVLSIAVFFIFAAAFDRAHRDEAA